MAENNQSNRLLITLEDIANLGARWEHAHVHKEGVPQYIEGFPKKQAYAGQREKQYIEVSNLMERWIFEELINCHSYAKTHGFLEEGSSKMKKWNWLMNELVQEDSPTRFDILIADGTKSPLDKSVMGIPIITSYYTCNHRDGSNQHVWGPQNHGQTYEIAGKEFSLPYDVLVRDGNDIIGLKPVVRGIVERGKTNDGFAAYRTLTPRLEDSQRVDEKLRLTATHEMYAGMRAKGLGLVGLFR